ncbi:MRPS5 [Auxenochlorella protothecoides x Auxenochlorella symbiontica]
MRAAAAAQALRLALRCSSLRTLAPSWEACSTSASVDSLSQMARLLPALQQRAGFAAGRGIDTESIEDGLASPKSPRRPKSKSRPKPAQGPGPAPKAESETQRRARQERMRLLLQDEASSGRKGEAARAFVANFFAGDVYQGDALGLTSEDDPVPTPDEAAGPSAAASSAAEASGEDEAAPSGLRLAAPEAMTAAEERTVLAGLQGLKRGSQRIVLQQLLQGKILDSDPEARREWAEIERSFAPPTGLRMRVVDINRTSKGTRSGGLYRFGAMVVVGNGEGVLGWGQGKAAELQSAVKKAYARACSNLFPIPRYNGHTIPEGIEAKFGQVKLVVYPKSAGSGIIASEMIGGICKMAGIHDIGVKVHGSRNRRNAVKCLFEAFDKIRSHDEITGQAGKVVVARPPGRFAHARRKLH